jgi:hypothetical protein
MYAFQDASEQEQHVHLQSTVERPAALPTGLLPECWTANLDAKHCLAGNTRAIQPGAAQKRLNMSFYIITRPA